MGSILFAVMLSLVFVPMWCLGLRMVTDYKEHGEFHFVTPKELAKQAKIFWKVRRYMLTNYPELGKPIITCVSCMPSLHSALVMLFIWWLLRIPITFEFFICIPFIAVCSSFTSGYYWSKYDGSK
jgi:hypothetical protein